MTNADKIRAMSDEELAAWIDQTINGGFEWFDRWQCDRCKPEHGGKCPNHEDELCDRIRNEFIDWLRTEVEE